MVMKSAQEEFRRTVPEMEMCWHCRFHVYSGTKKCPHCGSNVKQAAAEYQAKLDHVRQLKEQLEGILQRASKKAKTAKKKTAKKKTIKKRK